MLAYRGFPVYYLPAHALIPAFPRVSAYWEGCALARDTGKLGFWEVFAIGVEGIIGDIFAVLVLSLELAEGPPPSSR